MKLVCLLLTHLHFTGNNMNSHLTGDEEEAVFIKCFPDTSAGLSTLKGSQPIILLLKMKKLIQTMSNSHGG